MLFALKNLRGEPYLKFEKGRKTMGKARENKAESVVFQVQEAMKTIERFGESKHEAKEAFKAGYDGNKAIDEFMHNFAKTDGIHSVDTFKDYLSVSIRAAQFAKQEFGIKEIKNINAEHIQAYLHSQAEKSRSSINNYKSALEKFETALSVKYGQKYDFKLSEQNFKNASNKDRAGTYAYERPNDIIKYIEGNRNLNEAQKVAINVVRESGVRFHKTFVLGSLKIADRVVYTTGKGGRYVPLDGYKELSKETIARLEKVAGDGKLKLKDKEYKAILKALKSAAKETSQRYEALHGLKKNFASDVREKIMTEKNVSYREAIKDNGYIQSLEHNRSLATYEK